MLKFIFMCFIALINCNVYAVEFDLYELTDSIKSSESYKNINDNSNKSLHVEVYPETCVLIDDECDDTDRVIFYYNDYSMNYYFTYVFNYDLIENLLFYNIKINMDSETIYEELLVSNFIIDSLKEGYLSLHDIEYIDSLVLSNYGFISYNDIYYSNLINKSIDYTKYLSINLDYLYSTIEKDTVLVVSSDDTESSSNLLFYNLGAVFVLIIIALAFIARKLYKDNY